MSAAQSPAPRPFSYGGQAVIEGVMMRGAHKVAIAVRDPQGAIVIHEQPINAAIYRGRIAKTPFVRGVIGLWDALVLGTRALMWSADIAAVEEDTPAAKNAPNTKGAVSANGAAHPVIEVGRTSNGATNGVHPMQASSVINASDAESKAAGIFNGPIGYATLAVSLTFSVGLFFILPTAASTGIGNLLNLGDQPFLVNVIEGVIQLVLLIGYMALIGLMPDVKRLFGYHGAEHKTINAYEAGATLTPEVVAQYPIEHPRCGTAFLLVVAVVGIFVFGLLGRPPLPLLILSRIILIPVIAGIAYEVIRFTARHIDNPLIRIIVIPNLALQHLTTRQPDLTMIEVAITAFQRVLVSENLVPMTEAERQAQDAESVAVEA